MAFDDARPPAMHARRLTPPECARAARLHAEGLPEDFIARFGEPFLERYYRASLKSPFADVIAAHDPARDEVVGVLLGTFDTPAHNSFLLKRHGASLALLAVARSVRDPALGLDLVKSRGSRYLRGVALSLLRGGRRTQTPPEEKVGLLAHLVVDKDHRGRGAGRALVELYELRARQLGLERLELVTRPANRGAGAFYRRLGWTNAGNRISRSDERFKLYTKTPTA